MSLMAKQNQTTIDYQQCFGSEHGKRVLGHLKKLAMFNVAVVPRGADGKIDALEVMRQEGMRSVIIHIENQLKKDPNEVKGISNDSDSQTS